MLIGELSEKTGFSRDTIRYYEKVGLLTDNEQARRSNNYKDYGQSAVERMLRIGRLKEHGFTLSEIRDLLAHVERMDSCHGLPEMLRSKIADIDEHLGRLQAYRERLAQALDTCKGSACSPDPD